MAEEKTKTTALEREYVIPLRREWLKLPEYRRAGRAAKAIKKFIAKHMKVPERDTDNVKLDIYLNNEIWSRGVRNPPARVKVRAKKEGDIVKVELVETPEHLKFLKAKHGKIHKKAEKKTEKAAEKAETKPTEEEKAQTEEQKKDEAEKEKAGEEKMAKEAKQEKLADKHVTKGKEPEIHRRSMNRH